MKPESGPHGTVGHWGTHLLIDRARVRRLRCQFGVDSFSAVLNRQPAELRKSMTQDQGRERHGHKILTERTVYS
jgi:IS30 family transposase